MPTTTWNLPGGHRITGVPVPSDEFTPTFEEWFYSSFSPNLYSSFVHDKSGESAFYVGVNFSLLTLQGISSDFAAARGVALLRHTPQIAGATIAREFFEEHDALGVDSPAHRHNQDALSFYNQGVAWVHHQLR